MVSVETLLSYPDWKIPFNINTDASDKQLVSVIIQNSKPNAFFSRRLIKPQHDYTMTKTELFAILERLKKLQVILFGYEINLFSDHNNLVYVKTLSESKTFIHW